MAWMTTYPPVNNSPQTTLTASINSSMTWITVDDASVFPAAPNVLTIGTGDDAELVLCSNISGNIITVSRGFNDTTAKSWDSGTYIYRAITAQDILALQNNADYNKDSITSLESTKQDTITATGLLKGDGTGTVSAAVEGTDYAVPPAVSTSLPTSGTALAANTIYNIGSLDTEYVLTPPPSGWAHLTITTGASAAVTFATGSQYLGSEPTINASTTYELDVLNGVWAVQEVLSA